MGLGHGFDQGGFGVFYRGLGAVFHIVIGVVVGVGGMVPTIEIGVDFRQTTAVPERPHRQRPQAYRQSHLRQRRAVRERLRLDGRQSGREVYGSEGPTALERLPPYRRHGAGEGYRTQGPAVRKGRFLDTTEASGQLHFRQRRAGEKRHYKGTTDTDKRATCYGVY